MLKAIKATKGKIRKCRPRNPHGKALVVLLAILAVTEFDHPDLIKINKTQIGKSHLCLGTLKGKES